MSSVNKVIIVGRLGNDPEVRQFQNGGGVTSISVATSDRWTDKNTGEQKEQTEWHRVSLFNRLGEIAAQYLRKGSMVYIEGSLHTRKYTDQQGIDRYATEIRASEMRMLGGGNRDNGGNDNYGGGYQGGYQDNGSYNRQAQNGYSQNNYQNTQPRNNYQNNRQNFNQPQNYPMGQANDYGDMNQDYDYDVPPPASRQATAKNMALNNNFGSPVATGGAKNMANNAPKPMAANNAPEATAPNAMANSDMGQINDDDMPF